MLPISNFTTAQAFFPDEREALFTNSLHPELYGDRLTAVSIVCGAAFKILPLAVDRCGDLGGARQHGELPGLRPVGDGLQHAPAREPHHDQRQLRADDRGPLPADPLASRRSFRPRARVVHRGTPPSTPRFRRATSRARRSRTSSTGCPGPSRPVHRSRSCGAAPTPCPSSGRSITRSGRVTRTASVRTRTSTAPTWRSATR